MRFVATIVLGLGLFVATTTLARDPCGMVPPIYTGNGQPITRIGLQQTYVFFKDGVETFVIRPGFQGKVDEFGMLIPFPNPPALRKVPDAVFSNLAASVDPPEIVINLNCFPGADGDNFGFQNKVQQENSRSLQVLRRDQVRVVKQEAVGMYEVAVLEAGSAKALKRWIDSHGFRYPDGMDQVANDYVELGWCFVAVKTKVGQKAGVDPTAGQREVNSTLPSGSNFDGHVQAMGFRFKSDELVVPMRLSAFNDGDLRNVVYLLTEGPRKIRSIPEEYVVRQIGGKRLFENLTRPLPLRIIGGTEKNLTEWHVKDLKQRRDPIPWNGIAKELFAADLIAIGRDDLSLPHEEDEKELLRIGEHFGLRGPEIDSQNASATAAKREKITRDGLAKIRDMTLTVVDGDFPRDVLAKHNLTFAEYTMPTRRNNSRSYDANINGPSEEKVGVLRHEHLDWDQIKRLRDHESRRETQYSFVFPSTAIGFATLIGALFFDRRRKRTTARIQLRRS